MIHDVFLRHGQAGNCLNVQAEMTVKDHTPTQKLAGAIAGRVRSKEPIYLLAQGAEAVANAVSAVCHSRMFLEVRSHRSRDMRGFVCLDLGVHVCSS